VNKHRRRPEADGQIPATPADKDAEMRRRSPDCSWRSWSCVRQPRGSPSTTTLTQPTAA